MSSIYTLLLTDGPALELLLCWVAEVTSPGRWSMDAYKLDQVIRVVFLSSIHDDLIGRMHRLNKLRWMTDFGQNIARKKQQH